MKNEESKFYEGVQELKTSRESEPWTDVKSRLGCELSQFPATVGGVRTAQTFATALIHCFSSSSSSSSSPTSSSCQAAWPAAAGQSRKLWREETLAAPRRETPRFPNEHTDPAEQSGARAATTAKRTKATARFWVGLVGLPLWHSAHSRSPLAA